MQPHPWDALDTNMAVGDKIAGKVVVLADYGAFIEIAPGVEGLVHTTELENPNVAIDTDIDYIILSVDYAERRFELSQKAATRGLDETHNKAIQAALNNEASPQNSFAEAFARAKATKDNI
ncbi:MAG: S1 RNA-binding domain-containing protein [Silvanigrellaceae bacterium]|nr:S1 RNA-binding domain-containing protein [Silvanigrellaceae bacterium]